MVQIRKRTLVLAAGLLLVLAVAGGGVAGALGSTFADVPPSHPFFDEIEWMNANDIAGGYNDGSYRPGAPVSRAAMAAFMERLNAAFYTRVATNDPPLSSVASLTASCDPGDRVLMGSGTTSTGGMYITDSYPSDVDTWFVRWEAAPGTQTNANLNKVTVLCAPLPLAVG
ncbi:hypothetical protein B7486_66415 [cyanobacterium TDX16]|nr:hypothetical protein B7486_66415 [cyanobacterium TDX16]